MVKTILIQGWTPALGQFGPGMWLVRNAVPAPGGWVPIPAMVEIGHFGTTYDPAAGSEAKLFFVSSGRQFFLVIDEETPSTNRRILRPNGTVADTITLSVDVSVADAPMVAQYGPWVVFTHGRHAEPTILNEDVATPLGAAGVDLHVGTSEPWAKFCGIIGPHLVLANLSNTGGSTDPTDTSLTVDPNLVWISRPDTIRNFETITTNRSGTFTARDEHGPITAVAGGKNSGAIFKEGSLWRADYDSAAFFPLRLEQLPHNLGTLYPRSVVAVDTEIYFWSANGPAIFDGAQAHDLAYETLSRALVDQYWLTTDLTERVWFEPLLTWGSIPASVVGWYEPSTDKVCWAHTSGNIASNRYTRIVVYDRATQKTSVVRSTNQKMEDGLTTGQAWLDVASTGGLILKGSGSVPQWHPFSSSYFLGMAADNSKFTVLMTEREGGSGVAQFWDAGQVIFRAPYEPHEPGRDPIPYQILAVRPLNVDSAKWFKIAAADFITPPGRPFTLTVRSRNHTRGAEGSAEAGVVTTVNSFAYNANPNADGWYVLPNPTPAALYQSVEVAYTMDAENGIYPGADLALSYGLDIMTDKAPSGGI